LNLQLAAIDFYLILLALVASTARTTD